MTETADWKQKYRDSLLEMEAEEKIWRQTEQALRRLVGRLCAAGMGVDPKLDDELVALAAANRRNADAAVLEKLAESLTTAVVAVVSLFLFAISANVGSVNTIMTDAITAIGLQIAVYYGLAGLAAVIGFRKYAFKSVKNFFFMGLFPLLGSLFMFWIFAKSIPGLTATENSIGIGALAIGIVPLIYYYIKGSPYLHETPTLGRTPIEEELPTVGTL